MSEKLKPCPFCGGMNCVTWSEDGFPLAPNCLRDTHNSDELFKAWNTRPIEDALQKRIEELTGALNLATDAIAAVVGCCTYADIEKCQTGAYGISIKAGNLIHKFLTNHHDLLAELSE